MILPHPGLLNPPPGPPILKDAQCPPQGTKQRLRRILVERKSSPHASCGVEVLHRIREPAGRVDQRDRAVAQAVHLIQPARLEPRRHQEHVGAGLNEVRQRLVEPDVHRRCDRG